jgi:hypothetical protein
MIRQCRDKEQAAPTRAPGLPASWGIIEGSIQPTNRIAKTMEAERINAISALLNDLTGREAELRRYL